LAGTIHARRAERRSSTRTTFLTSATFPRFSADLPRPRRAGCHLLCGGCDAAHHT
jgi:hypothetical protein